MELTSAHKNWIALAVFVLGCLAIGFSSSLLSSASSGYTGLDMPPLSPPGILFPIAWTILYILMGISIWSVYRSGGDKL
ncbi:MAG: tryptophan-rich sensory protein, partial [Thermoplasmata archaeon]|nr:tryptophan-rich sensory protein [Thermoplasmata archaeon]